jgi:hypothetical protein
MRRFRTFIFTRSAKIWRFWMASGGKTCLKFGPVAKKHWSPTISAPISTLCITQKTLKRWQFLCVTTCTCRLFRHEVTWRILILVLILSKESFFDCDTDTIHTAGSAAFLCCEWWLVSSSKHVTYLFRCLHVRWFWLVQQFEWSNVLLMTCVWYGLIRKGISSRTASSIWSGASLAKLHWRQN